MFSILFYFTLVMAVADWIAVGRRWIRVRYVTKPATLLLLIAWFTQSSGWVNGGLWFGLALVFSLAGDVLLQLPERFFLFGLVAFLTAHLCYLVGFNLDPFPLRWEIILPIAIVLATGIWIARRVLRGLNRSPETAKMKGPVVVYSSAISLMLLSALLCLLRPEWPLTGAILASVGALLFFISDSVLATGRFVQKMRFYDEIVMVTYHLGQVAIIAGALMRLGG